jgi:glycosyltransferase involved in cell wall biosynthesis
MLAVAFQVQASVINASFVASKDAIVSGAIEELGQMLQPVALPPLPEDPLVSVLVANFNHGDYIGQTIESVQGQSYGNFELIICDDGSTDQSCEVISKHRVRDSRIRLLRQQNSGQAPALNAAYGESRGEVICLLDADDRYLPEKLDAIVDIFRTHPDSGFVAHQLFQVDNQGCRVGMIPPLREPPCGWYGDLVLRTGEPPPGLVPTSGLCMRRTVAALLFPLPEKLRLGADTAICSLAPLTTRLIGVPLGLSEYRYHGRDSAAKSSMYPSLGGNARFQITLELLNLRLGILSACWTAQRDYLRSIHPSLADAFPPLEERLGFQAQDYVRARLSKDKDASGRAYRRFIQNARFPSIVFPLKCFWAASILLPLPVFRHAVDWVWGERSSLIWFLIRVLRFLHGDKDPGFDRSKAVSELSRRLCQSRTANESDSIADGSSIN